MYRYLLLIMILLLAGCVGLRSPEEARVTVSELLDQIQIAVNEINERTSGRSLPDFKYAEITLSTSAKGAKEASANFVLSGEGKWSKVKSNTLTLVLTPDKPDKKLSSSATGRQLAEYVIGAVDAIDRNSLLALKKLTIETGFNVTAGKAGGVEIDVVGISAGGKLSTTSSDSHTLKLVFENN